MRDNHNAVTVVTVTYNAIGAVESTIKSVLSQRLENIEFVIVDGGSSDGTLVIIDRYRDEVASWVSEPDQGIYDAMNKGARMATSDWVLFMNAGDIFGSDNVVANALKYADRADLIYGDSAYDIDGVTQVMHAKPIDEIWKGMPFSHQALFVKRELLLKHPFDISLKIGADYEFIASMYAEGRRFVDCGELIAIMDASGVSRDQRLATYDEWAEVARRYFDRPEVAAFHRRRRMIERLKAPIRRLMFPSLIARFKNRL